MNIRTESHEDYRQVYELNDAAFGNRDDESRLVERIRESDGFIPELSLVAEIDGVIVGHALFSKAVVIDEAEEHPVIVLAPIAVSPAKQKTGIGGNLILEGLERCRKLGYGAVLLIGHPSYYPKFGFRPARAFGLDLKQFQVPDEVFMACELFEGSLLGLKGELVYPPAFFLSP